jgi:hypothetical protein
VFHRGPLFLLGGLHADGLQARSEQDQVIYAPGMSGGVQQREIAGGSPRYSLARPGPPGRHTSGRPSPSRRNSISVPSYDANRLMPTILA